MKRTVKLASHSLAVFVSCFPFVVLGIELPAAALSKLGSEQFADRQQAQDELLEWSRKQPVASMDALYRHTRTAKDPEVRERCRSILKELVTDEYLKDGEGYIGIGLMDDFVNVPGEPEPRNAVRISLVQEGSPGQKAGIRANDLILAVDGENGPAVQNHLKFQEEIRTRKPGSKVKMRLLRGAEILELEILLGRRLPVDENLFPNGRNIDPEALDLAAKEAHFRRWMEKKKLAE